MHASQEKLWYNTRAQEEKSKTESTWYFLIVSEPSEWLGRKCLTRTSTSHWRYFSKFRSYALQFQLQSESTIWSITWIYIQDQQKINKFARQNQKLEDIKDDIKVLLREASLHWWTVKVIFDQPRHNFQPIFSDVFYVNYRQGRMRLWHWLMLQMMWRSWPSPWTMMKRYLG